MPSFWKAFFLADNYNEHIRTTVYRNKKITHCFKTNRGLGPESGYILHLAEESLWRIQCQVFASVCPPAFDPEA